MGKTDLNKLRVLLPHWIEHNAEHAEEFRQWAAKARTAGQERAAKKIGMAASELESVNVMLEAALALLPEAS